MFVVIIIIIIIIIKIWYDMMMKEEKIIGHRPSSSRLHAPDLLTLPLNVQKENDNPRHHFHVCNSNARCLMQRSYVQQAASRKHALKLRNTQQRRWNAPGRRRPNFHSSTTISPKMMTRASIFHRSLLLDQEDMCTLLMMKTTVMHLEGVSGVTTRQ